MSKFEPPRATRDLLPGETAIRNRVKGEFVRAAESYGFQEIQTPVFEHLELFSAGSGPEIKGSMLTFHCDHEEFALRPEMTAPVCRLMSSGAFEGVPKPHRLYYIGPCFRYCRPQSGRYREFTQAGLECVGAEGIAADAEVIALACRILRRVGVSNAALKIGNIGIFRDLLPPELAAEDRGVVIGHLDQLISIDEKCRQADRDLSVVDDLRFERTELAALQAQVDYSGPYSIADRPHLNADDYAEHLPKEAEATFRAVWKAEDLVSEESAELLLRTSRLRGRLDDVHEKAQELLAGTSATAELEQLLGLCRLVRQYGVEDFEVVLGIARGFTFYTSTVFEISDAGNGGGKYCGGGRYDGLIESFGGPSLPSTGCAFRFEALVEAFRNRNKWEAPPPFQLFLLAESDEALPDLVGVAEELRGRGLRVGVAAGGATDLSADHLQHYKTEAIGLFKQQSIEKKVLQWSRGAEIEEVPLDADAIAARLAQGDEAKR